MQVAVTPVYAGLLGLVYLALTWRVITRRGETRTSLGDGGDTALTRRIRAHANFAEFAPLGLVLLLVTELMGAPAIALHLAGLSLLLGRAMHGLALTRETPSMPLRSGGMVLTLLMILATSLALVAHSLW
ncbi:MAPEG family protein [Roseivivax sp. CAU 1753]